MTIETYTLCIGLYNWGFKPSDQSREAATYYKKRVRLPALPHIDWLIRDPGLGPGLNVSVKRVDLATDSDEVRVWLHTLMAPTQDVYDRMRADLLAHGW